MATLIRVDGTTADVTLPAGPGALAQLQALVGGYIEVLRLRDGRFLVLNEDGKRDQPLNRLASVLAAGQLAPGDYIVGDVVVCTVSDPGTDDERWS